MQANWWPSRIGQNLTNQAYPAFLSASQKKSADEEWQKLSAINAPNLLCSEAIAQGRARSERRACARGALSMPASRAPWMFERPGHCACPLGACLLHRRYSKSDWAATGSLWYKGDNCPGPAICSVHPLKTQTLIYWWRS
jgi:hypothetical protein